MPANPTFDCPLDELPLALAALHRGLDTGDPTTFDVLTGGQTAAHTARMRDVVGGAGFGLESLDTDPDAGIVTVAARRLWELPDHVGSNMRLLLVGLNPSPAASDTGIGFERPGNRFWPALLAAGLATADRDPRHLLEHHRTGMTDLVKRTTSKAAELDRSEFETGIERLNRLATWLEPKVVVFVGLQGWRLAIDRKAKAGPHDHRIGGCQSFVMPNPSGLNANHQSDDFVGYFVEAAALADSIDT